MGLTGGRLTTQRSAKKDTHCPSAHGWEAGGTMSHLSGESRGNAAFTSLGYGGTEDHQGGAPGSGLGIKYFRLHCFIQKIFPMGFIESESVSRSV